VQKWKILLIDDEEDFFPRARGTIDFAGDCSFDGYQYGTSLCSQKNTSPHLVVLDVQLPLDIVRCLTLEYPHVPVIILTDIGNHLPGEEGLSLDARPFFS
jgi:DNA-binding response OmpR family regulator